MCVFRMIEKPLVHADTAVKAVAAALMTLHVAANAEGLATSVVGTLKRLLSGVRVAVDA